MSVSRKTIDNITRTLTTLTGAERLPGRDGSGDFKTLISSVYAYFKNRIIDTNVNLVANSDDVTASQKAVKAYIAAQVVAATGMPIGFIGTWGKNTDIPTGWIEMDGTAISRTTYATWFALYGETFGAGDGSTTVNIPDTETNGDFIRHFKAGISAAIGTHQADQFQGFQIGVSEDITGVRDYWGISGNRDKTPGTSALANSTVFQGKTSAQGDSKMMKPTNDGTNGTPRTGTTTYPVNNAFIYIIKIS